MGGVGGEHNKGVKSCRQHNTDWHERGNREGYDSHGSKHQPVAHAHTPFWGRRAAADANMKAVAATAASNAAVASPRSFRVGMLPRRT